ncbi:DUF892 family protein [Chryseobacterium potabilaquae]|uniref:Uncharacterized protein n=1 Tax=Chryseobacterium potabilaquae TaxID=2675057 RepID=A0A6N4XCT6_9FLAO|nr:DUF892 family protein [Chryseobacterium potabilaquae]CAA7197559.1 hypothetical protein CHRY9293_03626 [Chryseobacterium potabilaquae]
MATTILAGERVHTTNIHSLSGNLKDAMLVNNVTIKKERMKDLPLHKFFVSTLKEIYFAENKIINVLNRIQKTTIRKELREVFINYQLCTKKHVNSLYKIFMLIKEGQEIKSAKEDSMFRDVVLVVAADTDYDLTEIVAVYLNLTRKEKFKNKAI